MFAHFMNPCKEIILVLFIGLCCQTIRTFLRLRVNGKPLFCIRSSVLFSSVKRLVVVVYLHELKVCRICDNSRFWIKRGQISQPLLKMPFEYFSQLLRVGALLDCATLKRLIWIFWSIFVSYFMLYSIKTIFF